MKDTIMPGGNNTHDCGCKRPSTWLWLAPLALVAVLLIAATFSDRPAMERGSAATLADELLTVPAAGVPFALERLRPQQQLVQARLRSRFETSARNSAERLHAAFGLIELDHAFESVLLEEVPTAPDSECRNLIQAFSHVKSSAVPALALKASEAVDADLRARFAILALHLGDPDPAQAMLDVHENPVNRTAFIHTFKTWHGASDDVADLLVTHISPAFRSGLCVALGTIDPAERGRIPEVLSKLYDEVSDGATHSAAGWALRQWNLAIPVVKPMSRPSAGREWFVNGEGLTMIKVPAGSFLMGTKENAPFDDESPAHEVKITQSVFMADCEVTVDQFLRFVSDSKHPLSEKPRDWPGLHQGISPAGDCPVQMVTWFDAVLYCNWLSGREGRQPCYQRAGKQYIKDYAGREEEHDLWICDFSIDGYRLPTEAEWEFAARAACSASYCFGDETSQLFHYAWFRNNSEMRSWPGGRKRPNSWGLFDMHGNVSEWCWDRESSYSIDLALDPTGPMTGSNHVLRGGAAGAGSLGCRCAHRDNHYSAFRSAWNGFRVCCGSSPGQANRLPVNP